ncbi:MAG: 16S rRNA (cytosine(1402)-N(4))-methyltransferase RsmH [Planctomycetota bacterium]|nr:16S rRNA (cytosine(1402)-N(4))-methyltransferase RsmH [Planctomycetota bacterium]
MTSSCHLPVLLSEIVEWLQPQPGQTIVDGTVGGGGHAVALAGQIGLAGQVLGLDRDPSALERAAITTQGLPVTLIHGSYGDLPEILAERQIGSVDGIVLDLGLSSDQLADTERGFSFQSEGLLDLRFDPTRGEPAWRLLQRLSAEHLADLIYKYGEERRSRRIARALVEACRSRRKLTAQETAEIIRRSVPPSRDSHRIPPATRTFQALRIAINGELEILETALRRMSSCLVPGGRLAIISFHSLEDRAVKTAFRAMDQWDVLTRKPVTPTDLEIDSNPRSRSAKLRVAACRPTD